MIRTFWICCAVVGLAAFGSIGRADEFEKMMPEITELYAKYLSEHFEQQVPDRQVKFEVDFSKATGLHAGQEGVISVPIKGLKEDISDPAYESEHGMGLCYLFMSPGYVLMSDGKAIDPAKLRKVKINDEQGAERESICLILTAKHVGGDDWRLYGFGTDKKPIISASFAETSSKADKAVDIRIDGAKNQKAVLEVIVHKRYSASFTFGTK